MCQFLDGASPRFLEFPDE
uniref:BLTX468 n=1 Tax=Nephila pilipes TaxID=299642 RepID=A0A076KUY7_NEPPI|nr:BLTX468 [Nephila pilipes]